MSIIEVVAFVLFIFVRQPNSLNDQVETKQTEDED
jgi:hypothetical protein